MCPIRKLENVPVSLFIITAGGFVDLFIGFVHSPLGFKLFVCLCEGVGINRILMQLKFVVKQFKRKFGGNDNIMNS